VFFFHKIVDIGFLKEYICTLTVNHKTDINGSNKMPSLIYAITFMKVKHDDIEKL